MFTSHNENDGYSVSYLKGFIIYMCVSVLCFVFGMIYEIFFSHDVFSAAMWFFFLVPLIGGAAVSLIFWRIKKLPRPGRVALNIYNSGIAALTVSLLMKGVFEIAYTDSVFRLYLFAASCIAIAAAVLMYLVKNLSDTKADS